MPVPRRRAPEAVTSIQDLGEARHPLPSLRSTLERLQLRSPARPAHHPCAFTEYLKRPSAHRGGKDRGSQKRRDGGRGTPETLTVRTVLKEKCGTFPWKR